MSCFVPTAFLQLLRRTAPAAAALLLAACNTIPPPATTTATVASRAPVHESSVYSNGTPVAKPAAAPVVSAPLAAPAPAAVAASATPASASALLLQAGTFSSQTSADSVAGGIRKQLPALAHNVKVEPRGANFRVLIGPFASEAERSQAAVQIRNATGGEVVNAAP